MHDYDTNDIERIFGLSPSVVRSLIRAGYLQPARVERKLRFSFQDLVLLRTVSALRCARIPARKIHRALRMLRASLPTDLPMSQISLATVGERIAVRDGHSIWETESGQYALTLDAGSGGFNVGRMTQPEVPMPSGDAQTHFLQGLALEDTDTEAARTAYAACLAVDPHYLESRINLGRILHSAGLLTEAERIYRANTEPSALLSFNLAVLLEDLDRETEAMAAYRDAITYDPRMADAHFNLARLYERAGDQQAVFRHLLAYRRLLHQSEP